MARRKPSANMGAAQELKGIVDRIVALQIEKKGAVAQFDEDIDDVYTEAESKGFDKKALKLAVRRRHESMEQRAKRLETEALADMYAAAIGDLAGKPLDDLTRRRIDEQMREQRRADQGAEQSAQEDLPAQALDPATPPETPEEAKAKGMQARRDGQRVVDNPYHSTSPLRAPWDEGWCEADGSNGMEVPAAWKRSKPEDDKPDDRKPDAPPAPGSGGDDARPQA